MPTGVKDVIDKLLLSNVDAVHHSFLPDDKVAARLSILSTYKHVLVADPRPVDQTCRAQLEHRDERELGHQEQQPIF